MPRSFYHASFRALESAFKDFVSAGAERRIAVFVDDLDRCLPDNALQVLESMKLFFDLDGFVFIVGLDEDIIEYAVELKYRVTGLNGTTPPAGLVQRVSGHEYIKKIFQVPYRMAPVSMSELSGLLRGAFEEANLSDEQREDLRFVVEPHLRYLVRDGTVNPREVKRYINLYTLQAQVYTALDGVAKNVVLALQTLSFRADWETVWNPLAPWPLRRRGVGVLTSHRPLRRRCRTSPARPCYSGTHRSEQGHGAPTLRTALTTLGDRTIADSYRPGISECAFGPPPGFGPTATVRRRVRAGTRIDPLEALGYPRDACPTGDAARSPTSTGGAPPTTAAKPGSDPTPTSPIYRPFTPTGAHDAGQHEQRGAVPPRPQFQKIAVSLGSL